ncbi:gamma-aminobutyric acid receptor subunit pi [Lepeophtheirus salmonis]|nr:gamma-aminobutyric acid receptor subunit pi-like [Lepeophtheirus salmonis]
MKVYLYFIIILMGIQLSNGENGNDVTELSTIDDDEDEDYAKCVKNALVVSEMFCLPSSYRKDVPPPMDGPVKVKLKLPVTEVSEINDQRSQISLRWTYKLKWPEPRMILNRSADWSSGEVNIRSDMVNHFWAPDIIIHDLVRFYKPEVLNQVAAFEVIKSPKSLYYKVRSDLTTVCKGMKFSRFPLDEHICYLKLTSFGYDDKKMKLSGSFSYDDANQRALPFKVHIQSLPKDQFVFRGSSSNYSVYGLQIRLTRCVSPYLLNVYLPTAVFVVMSWVSFLIPTDVVPARIVLLVTLCLVIINTFNNVTARIPVASQVTALEIWLLACISMVFGALAEYAFILQKSISNKNKRQEYDQEMARENSGMLRRTVDTTPGLGGVIRNRKRNMNGVSIDGSFSSDDKELQIVSTNPRETHHGSIGAVDNNGDCLDMANYLPPHEELRNNMSSTLATSVLSIHSRRSAFVPIPTLTNPQDIDRTALKIFPISFTIFNIGYWMYYLAF